MRVELHIESLALDGFGPLDGAAVGAAVEQALGLLLAERGLPAALAAGDLSLATLPGGSFTIAPGAGAAQVGAQLAQAIYGGLQP